MIQEQYEAVKRWPKKDGKRELLDHLKGDPIFIFEALKAKCYECSVGDDGGCTVTICPLYPYSQFNAENAIPVTSRPASSIKKTIRKKTATRKKKVS